MESNRGNPKHEEHENMLDWIGGRFDSEYFDATAATKAMKKGLSVDGVTSEPAAAGLAHAF